MTVKNAAEYLSIKPERKAQGLSKKYKTMFIEWAIEAHKIDPSKSVRHYYSTFLERLREKYLDSELKEKFYEKGIIEV